MIQIGIFYLLPFISIFIIFGKLGKKYVQESGMKTFIALLIFFGIQIISIVIVSLIILMRSKEITPASAVYKYGYHIHIFSFALATYIVYLYYRKIKQNFIKK